MLWPRRNVNYLAWGPWRGLNSARCDGAGGEPPLNLWYCSATALPLLHYCYGKAHQQGKAQCKTPSPPGFYVSLALSFSGKDRASGHENATPAFVKRPPPLTYILILPALPTEPQRNPWMCSRI